MAGSQIHIYKIYITNLLLPIFFYKIEACCNYTRECTDKTRGLLIGVVCIIMPYEKIDK